VYEILHIFDITCFYIEVLRHRVFSLMYIGRYSLQACICYQQLVSNALESLLLYRAVVFITFIMFSLSSQSLLYLVVVAIGNADSCDLCTL